MSMKNSLAVLVLLTLGFTFMLASCAKESEPEHTAGGVDWLLSMEEALARADKHDQPIMIDVYADWCSWCKRLDSDTYVDENVVAKATEFVSLKLDADTNRSVVSEYRIGGLPTILFLDAAGREIHRVVGYKGPGEFVREMDTALGAFRSGKGS